MIKALTITGTVILGAVGMVFVLAFVAILIILGSEEND